MHGTKQVARDGLGDLISWVKADFIQKRLGKTVHDNTMPATNPQTGVLLERNCDDFRLDRKYSKHFLYSKLIDTSIKHRNFLSILKIRMHILTMIKKERVQIK
jgi:hypothetical protein